MTVDFDTSDFDRTMKLYLKVNRRASEELINKKAMQTAAVAVKRTPVAGGGKTINQGVRHIIRELRQPRNDGNARGNRRWKNLGEAIIQQAKFKRSGKYYSDRHLQMEFDQLLKNRTNKVGFLKSGWIPALRILNREAYRNKYVGRDFIDRASKREQREAKRGGAGRGKDKGSASPASRLKLHATISNSVNVGLPQRKKALKSSLNYVKRDMAQYIARKLKQTTEKNFK